MKKSPVFPRYETNDYYSDEYNLHEDFSQFLDEAKHNDQRKTDSLNSSEEDILKTKQDNKKKKKPWKAFVLPWWKSDKKKDEKLRTEPKMRRGGFMSGPIAERSLKRQFSGPVMSGLFSPIWKSGKNNEMPYACLDQLGKPCADKNYGPVYLVT